MNKRINELINQCFIGTTDGKLSDINTIVNVERFAELIIRECAQLARDTDLEDIEGGDREVLRAAQCQILEHFGVEY